MSNKIISLASVLLVAGSMHCAQAQERSGFFDWVHGDWYLTVGAAGSMAPEFEGASKMILRAAPMISLGKKGPEARFNSRNDNISFALYEAGSFRAGAVGKIVFPRDDDSDDLNGLEPVKWGGELGGFAEFYPTDWLRVRGEVRQGVRATMAWSQMSPWTRSRTRPKRCESPVVHAFRWPRRTISTLITASMPRRAKSRA